MKNHHPPGLAILLAFIIFSGCNISEGSNGYSTIALKDYKYVPATLANGTEINIIAFSGGKQGKERELYYSQFIGTEKDKGDTIRILAAWIATPSDTGDAPIFSPAYMYDGKKEIRDASFIIPDNNELSALRLVQNLPGTETDTSKVNAALTESLQPRDEFVILQDQVPLFKRNYRTIIGVLRFKQQPW